MANGKGEDGGIGGSGKGLLDLTRAEGLVDKNTLAVLEASGVMGDAIGHLIGLLNNMDNIPNKKELIPKVGMVAGSLIGKFLSDASHAKTMVDKQYETFQERNVRLKREIEELRSLKETHKLEEELVGLMKELSTDVELGKVIKQKEQELGLLRGELKNRPLDKKKK